jgi:hypothetical protein
MLIRHLFVELKIVKWFHNAVTAFEEEDLIEIPPGLIRQAMNPEARITE